MGTDKGNSLEMEGRTLRDFLAVTREELAAKMDPTTLVAAAADEHKEFAGWMERTHWAHLQDEVAEHVWGFLGENIAGIFAGAWVKCRELKKAAKETLEDPASTADVALADHDFEYELAPSVNVLLNGLKVAKIDFKIVAKFAVSGLELSLKNGCVTRVRSGKCDCKAEITCAGHVVWTRDLVQVGLPGELVFSTGILVA